jgi:uncharacterized repeat protein (TIGR01451 family)
MSAWSALPGKDTGRPGRPRRGRMFLLLGAVVAGAAALVLGTSGALGGPSPSLFQLDGDATTQAAPPAIGADDWDKVFAGTSASFSHTFIDGSTEAPVNDTTAWTPSTKVGDPISAWSWQTNTSVINAKADITDAFAAAYKDGADTVMYFGLDRFDESGDANVGFWFLQDPNFSLNADGTFSGAHVDGDVFVKSGFLQGGGVAVPEAFVWQGTGLVPLATGALCTNLEQDLCAIDNDGVDGRPGTITVPWSYQDKDGNTVSTIAPNGFFEGGINLGSLFSSFDQGQAPCFTNFVAQTATSAGNQETLKDLAAGSIRSCGTIQLKKHWVGGAGNATLNIGTTAGGDDVATADANGQDGATTETEVHAGTYDVSENVTDASSYTSTLACFNDTNDNGTQDQGELAVTTTDAGSGSSGVAVGIDSHVICTYTNTRKTGTVEVKKTLIPSGDSGRFDFAIGATSFNNGGAGYGNNGTTGAQTENTGNYAVSESAHTGTDASNYTSTWSCTKSGAPYKSGNGTSVSNGVDVANGDAIVCTFTNTLIQGTIELTKTWVGAAGNVTLNIGSTAGAGDVASKQLTGTDGTTDPQTVNPGTYFVSEDLANASDYDSTLACVNGEATVTPGQDNSVPVGSGDHVTCTFTNSRKPTIEVAKTVVPSSDGGTFTFGVDDQSFDNGGDGYGNGQHTDPITVAVGDHTVSEVGNSDYVSSFSCTDGETTIASGDGTTVDLTGLQYGENVVCTFTNSRKPTVTVNKRLVPATDTGTFNFGIDDQTFDNGTDGYGDGGTTGAVDVSTGSHTITESGNGDTSLADYASTWSCSNEQSGTGTSIDLNELAFGDNVTCTFTNTRLATLVVVKQVDNSNGGGSKGPGDFTIHVTAAGLELPGSPAAGSSTGTTYSGLMPGTYKVGEDAVSGYSLTSITGCLADGSVVLEAGQTVTCTLTNTSAAPPPPPPPPPPAPKIDLAITKTGAPNPATVGNQITWTMIVTNNGPNGATGVTVADPVPAGTTFVSVATSQGTCTGGAAVSCQLGSMAVGSSVTITLVTTANTVGTLTNTATTVGNEAETNTANNTATASVVVNGAFVPTPPVRYCTAINVAPKRTLFVGRKTTLTLKVTQNGKAVKGIRIRIKGPSLSMTTSRSNAKGLVKVTVKPKRAGIVSFAPVSSKGCANPRLGVTGVFTPPVTG